MSVYCFTGVPGSGKSAHVARMIRKELDRSNPRPVLANFRINGDVVRHPERFGYVSNEILTVDYLINFPTSWTFLHMLGVA